jgi:cyclic pyranopterin phosphate synthase
MVLDGFGREIDYLRISLTDRCNLRCVYCMPLKGLRFTDNESLLTADEIETVVQEAAGVGFRKIRFTGGEPTLRHDLVDIVRRCASVAGVEDVGMTTNSVLLPGIVGELVEAGLKRINIHVDTLNPENLRRTMRFASIEEILAGIEAASASGLRPIKLNTVVVRDFNDEDVVELAALTLDRDWHVRFIELMPLGGGECARVALSQYVPNGRTRERIEVAFGEMRPVANQHRSDESRNFRISGAAGVVGFISPVSEPYCGTCNRMRITADGKFHLCLLRDDEIDVRGALRHGGGRARVREMLLKAVASKPTGHSLEQGLSTAHRGMFQIGG